MLSMLPLDLGGSDLLGRVRVVWWKNMKKLANEVLELQLYWNRKQNLTPISTWFNEAATIPCLGVVPPKHVLASPNATGRFLPHQRGLWSSSKKYLLTQMRSYYCELLQISSSRMPNRTRTQGQCSPGIWSLMDIKASGVNMIVKPQTAQLIRICTTEKWKTTRHWLEFPFCDCASAMSFHARF